MFVKGSVEYITKQLDYIKKRERSHVIKITIKKELKITKTEA